MTPPDLPSADLPPPDLPPADLQEARFAALEAAIGLLDRRLGASPFPSPTPLEDLSLRHLAKGVATARSALALLRAGAWPDACILVRAVFEQLFTYLWVVQDPARAEVRATMVTIKQDWANAKYLEGLAANADEADRADLLAEAGAYRTAAEALLDRLAAELGTTAKKVRDEASMRASLKAMEVNLGPRFSVPYAYYSGFVHTDGNALAPFGAPGAGGTTYRTAGAGTSLPLASDLHRVLLRLAAEVRARCGRFGWGEADAALAASAAWLEAADAAERALPR